MSQGRAVVRLMLLALVVVFGAAAMLIAVLLPVRIGGVTPPLWLGRGLASLLCAVLGVQVRCAEPERLRAMRGLVFPNHSSLLDAPALLVVMPARFLAAAEVQDYPLIGALIRAMGTVFVARGDRSSRRQARNAILNALQAAPFPPLVLFPEGRLGPGDRLFPFRHGAFEIAVEQGIPFVPCALRYRPRDVAVWHGGRGEPLGAAVWKLACSPQPVIVEVLPMAVVTPRPEDDPALLADAARTAVAEALGIDPNLVAEALQAPAR